MFQWSDLRVFLAATRTGSISRTANELGVSVSTASRRLTALENSVGKPLFARTPAGLRPTRAGQAMLSDAEAAERSALAAFAAVQSLDDSPSGEVTVALPGDMLLMVLLPRLRPFVEAFPNIQLRFEHGAELADLSRLQADIAVRIDLPEQAEELISTRLREVPNAVFATQQVLDSIDDPTDPRQHRWISTSAGQGVSRWIEQIGGQVSLRCGTAVMTRHAAAAGLGTALMPELFGELTPSLVRVPIEPLAPLRLYMIVHRAVRQSPRVRVVWDALDALLRHGGEDEFARIQESLESGYSVRT